MLIMFILKFVLSSITEMFTKMLLHRSIYNSNII